MAETKHIHHLFILYVDIALLFCWHGKKQQQLVIYRTLKTQHKRILMSFCTSENPVWLVFLSKLCLTELLSRPSSGFINSESLLSLHISHVCLEAHGWTLWRNAADGPFFYSWQPVLSKRYLRKPRVLCPCLIPSTPDHREPSLSLHFPWQYSGGHCKTEAYFLPRTPRIPLWWWWWGIRNAITLAVALSSSTSPSVEKGWTEWSVL